MKSSNLLNVLSTGTNIVKLWLSLCLTGCARFIRHCGKMYIRHLFSYVGFCRCDLSHEFKLV